jgi:hypothetical protein
MAGAATEAAARARAGMRNFFIIGLLLEGSTRTGVAGVDVR